MSQTGARCSGQWEHGTQRRASNQGPAAAHGDESNFFSSPPPFFFLLPLLKYLHADGIFWLNVRMAASPLTLAPPFPLISVRWKKMWPTPGRETLWRRLFIGGRVTFASVAYEQSQEYEATRKKAWRANATGCFGINNISWKACRPGFLRTNTKKKRQTTGGVGQGGGKCRMHAWGLYPVSTFQLTTKKKEKPAWNKTGSPKLN